MVIPVTLQYLREIRSGVSYKEDIVKQSAEAPARCQKSRIGTWNMVHAKLLGK